MRLLLFALVVALFAPAAQAQVSTVDFAFTCGTTAAVVAPPAASEGRVFTALTCWVDGAVPVFFGGPTVTTATGLPVCEDVACVQMGSGIYRATVRRGGTGCIVTTGTVVIRCQGPVPNR